MSSWTSTYSCSCNAYGTPSSDVRARTVWTQSAIIKLQQLTEMINAAKTELTIRSKSASSLATDVVGGKVDPPDFQQMLVTVEKLRSITSPTTGLVITNAKLVEIQRALNESQAECICNCNYCSCNCNVCTCNQVCTCNCNHCPCNCNHCPCNCNRCSCDCNHCSCNSQCSCNSYKHCTCVDHVSKERVEIK